jgi:hypothetical protein
LRAVSLESFVSINEDSIRFDKRLARLLYRAEKWRHPGARWYRLQMPSDITGTCSIPRPRRHLAGCQPICQPFVLLHVGVDKNEHRSHGELRKTSIDHIIPLQTDQESSVIIVNTLTNRTKDDD